ncbi:MAG: mce related protein [Gemmataceae bacterium]|nr:mce related protein [Gemmataceae bacterium]
MSQSLSRRQAVVLGLVVLAALGLGGYGVYRVADRQGFWADTAEITVGFPEAHDITPGTPVRVRGVDAGQVVAVEYPDHDGPGGEVTVRMHLRSRYVNRLYADATAQVYSAGVFGAKVIAVSPGTPAAGPLAAGRLRGLKPFSMDEAVAEVRDLAREAKDTAGEVKKLAADARTTSAEARGLIKDVREGDGTLGRLVKDDDLYRDLKDIAADAKTLVKRTDKAVGTVETEMAGLKGFVADGRDTLRSVKQGTDAVAKMPIIRGYVEDAAALLTRPAHARDRMVYESGDVFRAKSAVPSEGGKTHLMAIANWLRTVKDARAEVVVVAFSDPNDRDQTPASALEMTKKQSEAVVEFLKAQGVHKIGWTSRRKIIPLGMGMNPSPVVEKDRLPPSNVQVLLFTPQ